MNLGIESLPAMIILMLDPARDELDRVLEHDGLDEGLAALIATAKGRIDTVIDVARRAIEEREGVVGE